MVVCLVQRLLGELKKDKSDLNNSGLITNVLWMLVPNDPLCGKLHIFMFLAKMFLLDFRS